MRELRSTTRIALALGIAVTLAGCATTDAVTAGRLLDSDTSSSQIRSIQARAFDTSDREEMLRTVIATLQDLGFVLDAGELGLGTVSGTKYIYHSPLRITVSVLPRGESQLLVRASCELRRKPVTDPLTYQRFFAALSKAVFIEAQEVD